jgi:hypothetical protein
MRCCSAQVPKTDADDDWDAPEGARRQGGPSWGSGKDKRQVF